MALDLALRIAQAYRWHRRLGARAIEAPHCHIVADPTKPDVWDRNHADEVSARTPQEIEDVFAAMDLHLAHSPWRVAHSDAFTPEPFLARLAFDGYEQKSLTIQMARDAALPWRGLALDPRLVETDAAWTALARLALVNHGEGHTTGGLALDPETSAGLVAGYRARSPACGFYLAYVAGEPIAYAACAAAPNGLGMIEDVFTLPDHRRRGVASGMLAMLAARLRQSGCDTLFLGALADEAAKGLYARLGFRPVALARTWVKSAR